MQKLTIKELNSMLPVDVLEHESVKERFISRYCQVHGKDPKIGEMVYEKEKYSLIKLINQNEALKVCQGFSVYASFLDIASMGLTLAQQGNKPYLYIVTRGAKDGKIKAPDGKGGEILKDNWVKRMNIEVSPYGELCIRIANGQILYADNVKVVYSCDTFKPGIERNGQQYVEYSATIPRTSNEIIAAFVKITRPDKSFDFSWMVKQDWERLAGYSDRQNKLGNQNGKANDLYSSYNGGIDPGFLEAKVLKHGMDSFPKIDLGQFSKFQQTESVVQAVDYGLDDERPGGLVKASEVDEDTNVDPFDSNDEPENNGILVDLDDDMEF